MKPSGEPSDYRRRGQSVWVWVLAYGALLILVGGIALAKPLATGVTSGLFLGFILLVSGIAGLAAGASGLGWRSHWLDILLGILSILAALFVFWNPLAGALALVWIIGGFIILSGALEFAGGLQSRHHRVWLLLLGLIDLLLGTLLLFVGPIDALVFLAAFVGLSFILRGLFLALLALKLRSLARMTPSWEEP
ncbi:DUF308 domain-containing protein [Sphingopyxis indica]|uniref:HdeD family acid-resistance protein n=1 Tax=Sphingopyxis indica TaxID=436663 RepID=UPI002938F09A|nr:DUF308 domain-containing protein [Sphingopyxis indica]WOF45010.1 DUF308 domain-containing protein [Sphingopyxis indica]